MKNIILLFALILCTESFAGCEELGTLKKELQESRIFLKGYEQAKKDFKSYLSTDYISYEKDELLVLAPDLADKSTFEINMKIAKLIGEIMRLKRECR